MKYLDRFLMVAATWLVVSAHAQNQVQPTSTPGLPVLSQGQTDWSVMYPKKSVRSKAFGLKAAPDELPDHVNNIETGFFCPVFNQSGGSCGAASGVSYMWGYEINAMRGWQARGLGPGTEDMSAYFTIANQTGDMKLEANIEYRFPVASIVNGALFVDAGNVWNLPSDTVPDSGDQFRLGTLKQSVAVNYGLGIRADLSFLLARIDVGFQLHNPVLTDRAWALTPLEMFRGRHFAFHFGIGYPF